MSPTHLYRALQALRRTSTAINVSSTPSACMLDDLQALNGTVQTIDERASSVPGGSRSRASCRGLETALTQFEV
jgi:hypothetical protein